MFKSILECYSNIELLDVLEGNSYIELTLHDFLNKKQEFEVEVYNCVLDFMSHYKIVEYEFYNPKEENDEGYKMAFIKLYTI